MEIIKQKISYLTKRNNILHIIVVLILLVTLVQMIYNKNKQNKLVRSIYQMAWTHGANASTKACNSGEEWNIETSKPFFVKDSLAFEEKFK